VKNKLFYYAKMAFFADEDYELMYEEELELMDEVEGKRICELRNK
jgi:hypothetical protein